MYASCFVDDAVFFGYLLLFNWVWFHGIFSYLIDYCMSEFIVSDHGSETCDYFVTRL